MGKQLFVEEAIPKHGQRRLPTDNKIVIYVTFGRGYLDGVRNEQPHTIYDIE